MNGGDKPKRAKPSPPTPRHAAPAEAGERRSAPTDWSQLDSFLRTDPRDVGCAEAMEMLHVYAELSAAGGPAEYRYPGIAAHLRACGPCGEDFEGLLAALNSQGR